MSFFVFVRMGEKGDRPLFPPFIRIAWFLYKILKMNINIWYTPNERGNDYKMKFNLTNKIEYIGVNDKTLDLFESQYIIPNGV